jgi:hypothetical protein
LKAGAIGRVHLQSTLHYFTLQGYEKHGLVTLNEDGNQNLCRKWYNRKSKYNSKRRLRKTRSAESEHDRIRRSVPKDHIISAIQTKIDTLDLTDYTRSLCLLQRAKIGSEDQEFTHRSVPDIEINELRFVFSRLIVQALPNKFKSLILQKYRDDLRNDLQYFAESIQKSVKSNTLDKDQINWNSAIGQVGYLTYSVSVQ